MRPLPTFAISTLLACIPAAPPSEAATTDTSLISTTGAPPTPTTTDSDTSGPANATDDHDFIVELDVPPRLQCDPFAQDCPEGEKCVPWSAEGGTSWDALKCVNVTGDAAPGEPCTAPEGPFAGIDDCALGSICWEVDAGNHGTCIAQCTLESEVYHCPAGYYCATGGDTVLALCLPQCDPLLQDCPYTTENCIPFDNLFLCVLGQAKNGGQANAPCEAPNACDKGLLCLATAATSAACDPQSKGCCTPFCKLPNAPCPNPDQLCLPWFDPMQPIPPGYEDVGFCGIPE